MYQEIMSKDEPTVCDPLSVFVGLLPKIIQAVYEVPIEIITKGNRAEGYVAINWLEGLSSHKTG